MRCGGRRQLSAFFSNGRSIDSTIAHRANNRSEPRSDQRSTPMGRDKKKTATPRVPPPADEFGYGVYVKTRAYARHDSAQDFCRLLCTP